MHDHGHDHDASPAPAAGQAIIDPVCGMQVPVTAGARTRQYGDQTFYFCSDGCQSRFDADPWFYARARRRRRKSRPRQAPNGPARCTQIIRDAPGACPICGMALEPVIPSDEPSAELVDFTRRLWVSVAAAVPLVILTMGEMIGLPVRDWIGHRAAIWLEFLLATPIVLWAARPSSGAGWIRSATARPICGR